MFGCFGFLLPSLTFGFAHVGMFEGLNCLVLDFVKGFYVGLTRDVSI